MKIGDIKRQICDYMRVDQSEISREVTRFHGVFGDDFAYYDGGVSPELEIPTTRYVIATTPRTGCTYLSRVLYHLAMGLPGEYWNATKTVAASFKEYVNESIKEGMRDGSALGWKLSICDLLPFLAKGNFPLSISGWKWIFVTRNDIIAQAISLYKARKTGIWVSTKEWGVTVKKVLRDEDVDFDASAINEEILLLLEENRRWEAFFAYNNLVPLRITYEQISTEVLACIESIRKHIDFPQRNLFPGIAVAKQGNSTNDVLIAQFRNSLARNI